MRINRVRDRLARGENVIGIGAGLGSVLAAEALSQAGYDFVMVDHQHGNWDDESTMIAFRSICLGEAAPFLRVKQNDYYEIGRALDRGALGVVVPMVNSLKEAQEAARAVRYPPRGGRSMGPFATAFLGDDYVTQVDDQVYLAVQIESVAAVEQAEQILATEGVDGCWVGPADLSLSMGVDLETETGRCEHEAMILRVVNACQRTGKVPGIAGRPENAAYWLSKGFRYVTVGSELTVMMPFATDLLHALRAG